MKMSIDCISLLAMWTPGPLEMIVIGVVALLIFGKRLPEIAKGLGKSMIEFKNGIKEAKETRDNIATDIQKAKNKVLEDVKKVSGLNELEKS